MSDRSQHVLSAQAARERRLLRNVYLWMTAGLALTGIVALGVATNPNFVYTLVTNRLLFFGLIIGELFLVVLLSARIMTHSPAAATAAVAAYAVLNASHCL